MLRAKLIVLVMLISALPVHAKVTPDVIYGHRDGMALTYDVFPSAEPNGAGVLYMVSGGWFSVWQPPEKRLPRISALLEAGFTVFAVHHASAPRFKVPDAVSDVRAAVRHIKENATAYGIDADRLGVWGGSAGGHLSLMLGLNSEAKPGKGTTESPMLSPRYLANADTDASVAAVVAYFPPVDLRPLTGPNDRFPALDYPPELAAGISPILFVDKSDPPIKLIHGDADKLVPLTASTSLVSELEKAGVVHDLLVIEGGGHGFRNPERAQQARTALVAWFKEYL